jgi:hypothetical protein
MASLPAAAKVFLDYDQQALDDAYDQSIRPQSPAASPRLAH